MPDAIAEISKNNLFKSILTNNLCSATITQLRRLYWQP